MCVRCALSEPVLSTTHTPRGEKRRRVGWGVGDGVCEVVEEGEWSDGVLDGGRAVG